MDPTNKKEIVYINYFDVIDMQRAQMLMSTCTQILGQFQPDKIYFMFATPGGQVDAGIALYNFLRSIPPKIVMHNMGAVNSIGNVIFLAGDERFANPNTTFLFHGVEAQFPKDSSFGLSKLQELASGLSEDQNKIAGIIASHAPGIEDKEIRRLFTQGASKSTDFALEKGFITEVKNLELTNDDLLVNIGIQPKL